MATGIEIRHARSCRSQTSRCGCAKTYRAHVFDKATGRRIRKSFPSEAAAKTWRQDAQVALRKGTMRAPDGRSVARAAEQWLAGARDGTIRNRSGDPYKPSAVRAYDQNLRLRVLPAIGSRKFHELRRVEIQDLADKLHAQELSPSTVQCALLPLRAMYRRAVSRGELELNPTVGLELPAVRGGRDRIASPEEGARLLAALPDQDRAVWATAMYSGLRRGELMALRPEDVNLGAGTIRVERGWDVIEGEIAPKSRVGRRTVPIAAVLRDVLDEHLLRLPVGTRYVFGVGTRPFEPGGLAKRAKKAWKAQDRPLRPITLHECRHTFASLMIAAGVNAKALSTYMGHGSVQITFDKYGHLMPGNEDEAAALLDAYLVAAREREDEAARTAVAA